MADFPASADERRTISGFLRRRARRGLSVSRLAGLDRRGGTLGNGAVAHRACVTLLRAYNYPRVPFLPSLSPFLPPTRVFPPPRFVPRRDERLLGSFCRRKCRKRDFIRAGSKD